MRVPYLSFLALLGLYVVATGHGHTEGRAPVTAPSPGVHALASGAALALDAMRFCEAGGPVKPAHPAARGDAGDKRRLENFLHREVCSGRMPLRQAQADIAGNWLAAYRKYFRKFE